MKKLTTLCFGILFSLLSILAYLNFAFDSEEKMEMGMQTISIEKPTDITNEEYINSLSNLLENIGYDMMFKFVDVTNDKPEMIYYKTNNTENFIDLKCQKGTLKVEKGEVISTKNYNSSNFYRLNATNSNSDITIMNFKDTVIHDFKSDVFYVRNEDCEVITSAINKLGYAVEIKQSVLITGKYSIILFAGIPIILFIASIIFYGLSSGKINVLKKMDGFKNLDILLDNIKKTGVTFFWVFCVISVVTIIACAIEYKYVITGAIMYWLSYMIIGFAILVISYIVLAFIIVSQNKAEYIKGRAPKKGIYIISLILKSCFIIFIVFFLSIAIRNVILAKNVYKTSEKLSQKIEGYVSIPIYELNQTSTGLEKNYFEFYNATVDKYNGILIECRNYELDVTSGKTMCEEFGQDWITINSNYLMFNPIYAVDGSQITDNSLVEGMVTIFIPQTKKNRTQEIVDQCKIAYGAEANVIYYDQTKTKIYSYNASALENPEGEVPEPVIYVGNENIINETFIFRFITGNYYFIKPETSDPYNEFLPLIKKYDISGTTTKLSYVSDNFQEEINHWLMMLKIYATQSILLIFGLFSIIIFTSKLYCENYRNRISVYLIEGSHLLTCIRPHIIMTILSYIACFILMKFGLNFGIGSNYSILIFTGAMEAVIIYLSCKAFTRSNLNDMIKGAE